MVKRVALALIVVSVIVGLRFVCLGSIPTWYGDEGRWLLCAANKITAGDWTRFGVDYCYLSPAYVGLSYVDFRLFGIGILQGRFMNATLSLATLPLIFLVARRTGYSKLVGYLAVLMLGCDRWFALNNREVLIDSPTALFTLLAFALVVSHREWERKLTSVGYAVALCIKASALSALGPLLIVAAYGPRGGSVAPKPRRARELMWVIGGVILAGAVYGLLYLRDPSGFLRAWGRELSLRTSSAELGRGGTVLGTLQFLVMRSPQLYVTALVGLALMLKNRSSEHIPAATWLIFGAGAIIAQNWQMPRYWIVVTPALALISAWTIDHLFFGEAGSKRLLRIRRDYIGATLLVLVCVWSVGTFTYRYFIQPGYRSDAGTQFLTWANENIPRDKTVMALSSLCLGLNCNYVPADYATDADADGTNTYNTEIDLKKWPADYIAFDDREWGASQNQRMGQPGFVDYQQWLSDHCEYVTTIADEIEIYKVNTAWR